MEGQDLATTVLTCEGDIRDPTFPFKLQRLVCKLRTLISDEEKPFRVTKVEPWNSVRVTFNIPHEAAQRLRQLAERGDRVLRELGILSVQIEGDQVITLTLAGRYNEPQEIILRKTPDGHSNMATLSFDLPGSESSPGPSNVEATRKNIAQYLSQHGGRPSTSSAVEVAATGQAANVRTEVGFRSPNVVAPTSSEPIPFLAAAASSASGTGSTRLSHSNSPRTSTGFGPFPFASMTHAMNTKHGGTHFQPVLHVQGSSSRFPFSAASHQFTSSAAHTSTASSNTIAMTSNTTLSSPSVTSPQVSVSPTLKVQCATTNSVFNNLVSRVTTPNTITSTSRANVALSSPLLVNLLQSESSGAQHKLMPPPAPALNQPPKRKRKPRKPKAKGTEETASLGSPPFSTSPSPSAMPSSTGLWSSSGFDPLGVLNIPNISLSPPVTQTSSINPQPRGQPPVPTIHSQAQGQPPVPTIHSQVRGQPQVSTIHTQAQRQQSVSSIAPQTHGQPPVPNIHPQAQGQPQVHTGNLPLHTRIPVGAPPMTRPSASLQSLTVTRGISANTSSLIYTSTRENSSPKETNKTPPTTTAPESNPFPSPPPSTDGKTKHLINPFTGQLEPMPSDDDEEDESIGSLPPFPDFEVDTSENGQSERSLSDGGKDNTPSSDTDSGISKSHTDISQSSTDWGANEQVKESCKADVKGAREESKVEPISATASVKTGPGEKLRLRLKLDPKTLRDSKELEAREKRNKSESSVPLSHRIDVAVVSIPSVKKGTITGTLPGASEPRVPPLHISLRGPNAAVVVSPRKDDLKSRSYGLKDNHDISSEPPKYSQKKVRSPRTARSSELTTTCSLPSPRICDSGFKKSKSESAWEGKKGREEFWSQNAKSLTGGGIVEMTEKVSVTSVAPISSCDRFLVNSTVATSAHHNTCASLPVTSISTKPEPISASQGDKRTLALSLSSVGTCHQPCIPATSHVISSPLVAFRHVTESQTLMCSATTGTVTLTSSLPLCVTSSGVGRNSERTASSASKSEDSVLVRVPAACTQQKQHLSLSQRDSVSKGDSKLLQNMQGNHHLPQSQRSETTVDQSGVHDKTVVHRTISGDNKSTHSPAIPVLCAAVATSSTCAVDSGESVSIGGQLSKVDRLSEHSKHKLTSCSSAELKHQPTDYVRSNCCDSSQGHGIAEKQQRDKPISVACESVHQTSDQCNTSGNENLDSVVKHLSPDDLKTIAQNTNCITVSSDSGVCYIQTSELNQHHISTSASDEPHINSVDDIDPSKNEELQVNEKEKTPEKNPTNTSNTSKHVNHSENSICEPVMVSNHCDCHQLPLSNCDHNKEIEEEDRESDQSSDSLYMMGVKRKSSVAKIITVDTLPLQPHVIEVPSLHTSSAVPKTLAKTRLSLEVSTIPSLIPSHGSAFPVRNLVTVHQSCSEELVMEGRTFARMPHSKPVTVSQASQCHSSLQNVSKEPFLSNCDSSHVNHSRTSHPESLGGQVEGMVKEECASTGVPSEESSLDSLEEESTSLQTTSGDSFAPFHSSSEQKKNVKDECGKSEDDTLKDISNYLGNNPSSCRNKEETEERTGEKTQSNEGSSEFEKNEFVQDIAIQLETTIKDDEATGEGQSLPVDKDASKEEESSFENVNPHENVTAMHDSGVPSILSTPVDESIVKNEKTGDCSESPSSIPVIVQSETECGSSKVCASKSSQQDDEVATQEDLSTNETKLPDCRSSEPFAESDRLDCSVDSAGTSSNKAGSFEMKSDDGNALVSEQKAAESSEEQVKREAPGITTGGQTLTLGTAATTSVVTSLLSSRCLTSDAPAGSRVTLIFKGSLNSSSAASHSVLSNANSPTSVVLPINPSKTVPIKLVTLPGGASGLSVRSTSNPAVMEIIGSTSSSSHSSPSSSSPHSPSSVRLVVSKVSPVKTNVPTTAQSGTTAVRNRVVVKSVVVTGTSPSFKIVSAKGAICTTSPIPSTTTTVISTSPATGSPSYHPSPISVQNVNSQSESGNSLQPDFQEQMPCESLNKSQSSGSIECKSSEVPAPNNSVDELSTSEIGSSESKAKQETEQSCGDSLAVSTNNPETPSSANTHCTKPIQDPITSDCISVEATQSDSSLSLLKEVNVNDDSTAISDSNDYPSKNVNKNEVKSENASREESVGGMSQQPELPSAKSPKSPEILQESHKSETHSEDGIATMSLVEEITSRVSAVHPFPKIEEEGEENAPEDVNSELPSIRPSPHPKIENEEETLDESEQTEVEVTDEDKGNDQSEESQLDISLVFSKPLKRKCSENAAELIKACMGVDDNPKRLSGIKQKLGEEAVDKERIAEEDEKVECDQIRMNLRVRRDDSNKKGVSDTICGSKGKLLVEQHEELTFDDHMVYCTVCEERVNVDTKHCTTRIQEHLKTKKHQKNKRLSKQTIIQNMGGSDCSSEEEMSLSELASKSRAKGREESTRSKVGRPSSREAVKEGDHINCKAGRRRSGSNESRKSEEAKGRPTYRDGRKEIKDEIPKKIVDRTKKGSNNRGQDRRSPTRSGSQRANRGREQEARNNSLSGAEELINIALGKRKTRGSGSSDIQETTTAKRRRYSKDGHR